MREPETPAAFRVLFIWAASSPSQALPRQIPPFVTYGDIFPRSGGSLSSKGEPLAKPCTLRVDRKLYRHAKASPFGRGGTAQAVTERARTLMFVNAGFCYVINEKRFGFSFASFTKIA